VIPVGPRHPVTARAARRTLSRAIDLTGVACGALYTVDEDGSVGLGAHVGFRDRAALEDFFGHPDVLTQAVQRSAGRIVRLGSVGIDLPHVSSVSARAGLAFLLVVPMEHPGTPDRVAVLGTPRAPSRFSSQRPGHTERVSAYCRLLATACGLDSHHSDLIGRAAALHDVGKLTIPDEILGKAGALDPEERRVVERHSEHGWRILAGDPHPLCDLAAEIAWTHHERWDGTGYPRRLRGTEIPLAGRIAAIADVFDALTSDRSYRPAMSRKDAFTLMEAGAGTHFDPHLLRLFLAALPRPQLPRDAAVSPAGAVASRRMAGALA
jgi:HD-GYP domain-containing protein (c-di-GMP phosphodiesterase class II)